MSDFVDLNPSSGPAPAQAPPETTPPEATGAIEASSPTATGSLTLETSLLGRLVVPNGAARAAELEALAARAAVYATRARGPGTRRTYRSAWTAYAAWCHSLGREPLDGNPDTIAMYLVRRADDGLAVSSLQIALAAIRTAHLLASIPLDPRHPRLAMVLEGIVRSKGRRPRRRATPAGANVLRLMLATPPSPDTPLGARNRAMLLLGFAAALRRSELVALTLGDVESVPQRGLRVLVRRSKTDQQGKGQEVAIWANAGNPGFCPAAALEAWLVHRRQAKDLDWTASINLRAERPLFCGVTRSGSLTGQALSDKAVARLVKQAATAAGLDPEKYSGHSLRAGLATEAGDQGAGLAELMRQTRHKSTDVALGYLRPADLWRNNVTRTLFRASTPDPA